MRGMYVILSVTLLLQQSGSAGEAVGPSTKDSESTARSIATAWLGCREEFRQLWCEYTVSAGQAPTHEEGVSAPLQNVRGRARVVWAVDGDREVLRQDGDAAPPADPPEGVSEFLVSGFPDNSYIRLGDHFALGSGIPLSSMTIYGPGSGKEGRESTNMLSLGMMGPGETRHPLWEVESAIQDGLVVTGTLGATEAEIVIVRSTGADRYTFDPHRGMLLTSAVHATSIPPSEAVVLESRETPAGWFPTRARKLRQRNDGAWNVYEYVVEKLEAGKPVPGSVFDTPMESGGVYNIRRPGAQKATAGRTVVTPELVAQWYTQLEQAAEGARDYVAAKESVAPASASRRWWFIAAGAVLALGAVISVLRLRKTRNG